jgi:hypothetical protein
MNYKSKFARLREHINITLEVFNRKVRKGSAKFRKEGTLFASSLRTLRALRLKKLSRKS